jgi:hypothetical protein
MAPVDDQNVTINYTLILQGNIDGLIYIQPGNSISTLLIIISNIREGSLHKLTTVNLCMHAHSYLKSSVEILDEYKGRRTIRFFPKKIFWQI